MGALHRILPALLLSSGLLLAEKGDPIGPRDPVVGTPYTGARGITETVSEIMQRERLAPRPVAGIESEAEKIRRDRSKLPQNPASPDVASWPPQPASSRAEPLVAPFTAQTIGLGFQAASLFGTNPTFALPPDSMGAIGPTQFILCVNGRIVSFDKTTGSADGALNASTDSFFGSVRGGFSTSDPRIRYDRLSGRWFVIMINVAVPNRVLLAVSSGATVTSSSSFTFYSFDYVNVPPTIPTNCLGDYPTLGVDANALYMGVNRFCGSGSLDFQGTDAFVVRKSSLVSGGPIVVTAFRGLVGSPSGSGMATPQGVDNDDPNATTGYLVGPDNAAFGTLVFKRVANPGGTPSLSADITLTVPTTSQPLSIRHSGNTGGTNGYLDAIDDRVFAARVKSGHLWATQNIGVNDLGTATPPLTRTGSRWYEIQGLAASPSIVQMGTLFTAGSPGSVDVRNYWIPAIAVNGQGHAAMGFSISGTNEHVNAGFAGRLAGDAPGTLQTPTFLTNDTSFSYNPPADNGAQNGSRRWGDYSYTSLDPDDDMTLWTVQEFVDTTDSYGVWVAKLLAPPPAAPTSASPASVSVGTTTVVVTGTSSAGSAFYDPGTGFARRLAASVSGSGATVNSVTYNGPTQLTMSVTVSGSAPAGTRLITVTNPDGQFVTSAAILTVAGTPASIAPSAGTPQSAGINTAFTTPLAALVRDINGNPVAGASVVFAAPTSGASARFPGGTTSTSATSNGSGVATAPTLTANGTVGSYTVTATVGGAPAPANFALSNTAGAPASITATGGTPQSTAVGSAFAAPLQATVKDSGGNPIGGASVTFTAPAGGSSGTFPGGSRTATVTTSSGGVATSPTLTANGTVGTFIVTSTIGTLSASFNLTITAPAAASITATQGTPQSAQINSAFATAFQALVKDSGGAPVAGASVTFTAPSTGPSGAFPAGLQTVVVTNASGLAIAPSFTTNQTAGSYGVTASVTGVSTPATFALTNLVGSPAGLTATAGTPQSAAIGTAFTTALSATLKDIGGNPIPGATVTFTAPASGPGGTFTGGSRTATATTSASGIATAPTFTANLTSGGYAVTASLSSLSASFSLSNTSTPPASITAISGTPQSAQISTAFASALKALVKDANGNPVSSATVTFTAPASGASGSFNPNLTAAVLTDASGVATAPVFRANAIAGSYAVTAATSGVGTPAAFSLTNTAGAPATITATGGTPQSASIGTAFAVALKATVRDVGGNPLSGVTVTFASPVSGPAGTFAGSTTATVTTATNGVATAPTFTANGTTGSYTVTAGVAGLSPPATFSLTNNPGASVALSSSRNPSFVSQSVTFTAVVGAPVGQPTGTVTFKDGAASLGTAALASGSAAFTTSALALGTHTITASYGGDAGFTPATSLALTQQVVKSATTLSVSSSPSPATTGQAVTFTITVHADFGTPAGTVDLAEGGTSLGTATLSGGIGTIVRSNLAAGIHDVVATYAGDAGHDGSTGATTQVVNSATAPTTTLSASPNPAAIAQSVTFTALVTPKQPQSGTPTGTVTFREAGTTLGTAALSGGTASFTTSALSFGTHVVIAYYGGDGTFETSGSSALAVRIQSATATTLTASPSPSAFGQSVVLRAVVAAVPPATGTPAGSVTFRDGAATLGAVSLVNGVATITTTTLALGSHTVNATYGGDAAFLGSASGPVGETVNPGGGCASGDAASLCEQSARFRIRVSWRNPFDGGTTGSGTALQLTNETGYFWFFDPNNVELMLKVLDGRSSNGSFWVLFGALSDVEYTITVTDTQSGAVKTYYNPASHLGSFIDVNAFPSARPASAEVSAVSLADLPGTAALLPKDLHLASLSRSATRSAVLAGCTTGGTDLCVQASRFLVRVDWTNPYDGGSTGVGTAVPLTPDTGYFWFFSASNAELVVKVLDGTGANGHFWVLYGALSDVEYTVTVTDTQTGAIKTYHNPPRNLGSVIDTLAF